MKYNIKPQLGKSFHVDSLGQLHVILDSCLHCGGEGVEAARSDLGICVQCQKRYAYFYVQKQKLTRDSRLQTMLKYREVVDFYIALRDKGVTYKVPNGLNNEKERVETFIASKNSSPKIVSRSTALTEPMFCKDCGVEVLNGIRYGASIRCTECAETYSRYQWLVGHVGTLSLEECDELVTIIKHYAVSYLNGHKGPYIDSAIYKVNNRLEALGAERRHIYAEM